MYLRNEWQDWVLLFLGLWLFFVPMLTADQATGTAAWSSYAFGGIATLRATVLLYRSQTWGEWVNLTIGLCLTVTPFVFGYKIGSILMWNSVIVGLLIAATSLWVAISRIEPMPHEPPAPLDGMVTSKYRQQ